MGGGGVSYHELIAEEEAITSVRQLIADVFIKEERGFIRPTPCHIPDCIATTSKDQSGNVEALHKLHTLSTKEEMGTRYGLE